MVNPYSAGTLTLQEAPSFAWRTNGLTFSRKPRKETVATLRRRRARLESKRFRWTPSPLRAFTCAIEKLHDFGRRLLGQLIRLCVTNISDQLDCPDFIRLAVMEAFAGSDDRAWPRVWLQLLLTTVTPHARRNSSARIGKRRIRLPVAAKTALVTAEKMPGVDTSPTPPGFSVLGTMWVSTTGASFIRTIG